MQIYKKVAKYPSSFSKIANFLCANQILTDNRKLLKRSSDPDKTTQIFVSELLGM